VRCLFLLIFFFPAQALAALVLSPPAVDSGGVALLRWEGASPSLAVARFNERVIYLSPTGSGAAALLGTDVELPAGDYPITLAVVDRGGGTSFHRATLVVRSSSRPVERLTLPEAMVEPVDPDVLERIGSEHRMLTELFGRQDRPALWKTFSLPVSDPVSSSFGLRRILNGKPRSPHSGVDFRSPRGTPIRAAAEGIAVFTGDLYYTGNTVVLDHGEGLYTLYAHLDTVDCRTGERLEAGAALGRVGSSGRSTGPHLHWGGKLRGDRIDPLALVKLFGEEKP
jgi:murein DD-endopeptidase MepM/ murein hydrolase activator NlpD